MDFHVWRRIIVERIILGTQEKLGKSMGKSMGEQRLFGEHVARTGIFGHVTI